MNLKSLINLAVKKDEEFGKKIRYWILQRRKQPDLEWLMDHLERILGADYVREAAEKEISNANTASNETT